MLSAFFIRRPIVAMVIAILTVLVGVVYIGLNMLSDLLYRVLDPRAR